MREIEFRGLDLKGDWKYGYLFEDNPKSGPRHLAYIIEGTFVPALSMPTRNFVEVKLETVGQYTGLRDATRTEEFPNGKKIFEGDVFTNGNYRYKVIYEDGAFHLEHLKEKDYDGSPLVWGLLSRIKTGRFQGLFKVIGNIHQNKELLK